ncbi:MAG TPA: serine hydrolase domain-containing protein [Pyrinomonadaceae bacterium]|nr:serine hydrolase domain-containing protein [Pyrinomonadaceae bacterium]
MIQKTFIRALICAGLVVAGTFKGRGYEKHLTNIQSAPARDTVIDGQLGHSVDSFLSSLSGFGYSGVMLVVKDGKIVLRQGYGLANEAANVPNTPETVFDIGSLAKQFTATAILKLEMQGKLKVTDPISRYLPGVPEEKSGITIEQLLTHTSGLDRNFPLTNPHGEYYEEVNRTDALRRILEMPLIGEPGKSFVYSNAGYVLLAGIVEIVGERPFRDFLRAHIFEPAGMRSTGFWGGGLPPVKDALIARSYDESGETGDPRKWSSSTWVDLGGGEVVSTVGDLYKWHVALNGNLILSPAAKQKMFTPRLNNYGYGWFIQKTPRGTTLIQHGGDYFGFGSQFSWFQDENVLMINLANRSNQLFGTRHVADRLVPQMIFGAKEFHMYEGDSFELPPASAPLNPDLAKRFVGTYQLSTGGKLIIRVEKGKLEIGASGQDAVNALADTSDAEFQRRARLSERAKIMIEGLARGDSNAIPTEWKRPGAPVGAYSTAILNIFKEKGALRFLKVEGTEPGAYPRGLLNTVVRLDCEKGSEEFQFNWVNDRIIGLSQAPSLLARTPLRASSKTSLVGWSIIWFKAFNVSFDFRDEKVISLSIKHKARTIRARRIAV